MASHVRIKFQVLGALDGIVMSSLLVGTLMCQGWRGLCQSPMCGQVGVGD